MNNLIKILLLSIVSFFIIFCSANHEKGKKFGIIRADNPADSNFNIKLKLINIISFPQGLVNNKNKEAICFDGNQMIYIFDKTNKEIFKYSLSGSRYRFSNSAFKNINEQFSHIYLTYNNENELILFNGFTKKYYFFNDEGTLLRSGNKLDGVVRKLAESSDFYFIGMEKSTVIESSECAIQYLMKTDKKFNILDTISVSNLSETKSLKYLLLLNNAFTPYYQNDLYLPFGSYKYYRIHHLDNNLDLKNVITKKFTPVERTREEKEYIYKMIFGTLSIDEQIRYKGAIKREPFIDYKKRLWIIPSVDRSVYNNDDVYVDIFKDDRFINRVHLPEICRYNHFFIKNNKFIEIDNETGSINVYEIAN